MATVVEKRKKIIYNGTNWVEVYSPTTSDLVYVDGSNTTLATKLTSMETAASTHVSDTDLHLGADQRTKLANLAADANATYETKANVTTHTSDTAIHLSTAQVDKLTKLADDAAGTYATKTDLAGVKDTRYAVDIAARDALGLGSTDSGDICWVRDASADTTNTVSNKGAAAYLWDGTTWQFLLQSAEISIIHNWADINNKPTAAVADIDDATAKKHEHTNKSVIDLLTDNSGELAYNGTNIHKPSNRVFFSNTEPSDPLLGDMWLPEVTVTP